MQRVERIEEGLRARGGGADGNAALSQRTDQRRDHPGQARLLAGTLLGDDAPQQFVERGHGAGPAGAVLATRRAQRRQVVGPDGLGKRADLERQVQSGQAVAHERADVRPVGLPFLGGERLDHVLLGGRGGRTAVPLEKRRQLPIGPVEHRDVDPEIAAYPVDDRACDGLEGVAVVRVAGRADGAFGKPVEQAPRGVLAVREEPAIEQRGLDDRNLHAAEQLAELGGDRRIAEHVVEQQSDHVHRDAVAGVVDLVGNRGTDVGNQVERHRCGAATVLRGQGSRQRGRQIEVLPVSQGVEQRRRRTERHHRVEIGKVAGGPRAAVSRERGARTGGRRGGAGVRCRGRGALLRGDSGKRMQSPQDCRRGQCAGDVRRRCRGAARIAAVAEIERGRLVRFGQGCGHVDVRRRGFAQHAAEGRNEIPIVVGPQLAARPQLGLDLGEDATIGQGPVERDVQLGQRRCEVLDQSLHHGAPDPGVGIDRPRCDADRVEQVGRCERVVDVVALLLGQEDLDPPVERSKFGPRQSLDERGCPRQRSLLLVVEGGQYAQAAERGIEVRAAPLALDAAETPLVELAQRGVEAGEPGAALGLELVDVRLRHEAVAFEQVAGLLERTARKQRDAGTEFPETGVEDVAGGRRCGRWGRGGGGEGHGAHRAGRSGELARQRRILLRRVVARSCRAAPGRGHRSGQVRRRADFAIMMRSGDRASSPKR